LRGKLLDLFCKASGASVGYARAGFEVVGVDHEPQPRYPYEFIQADVFELEIDFLKSFDAIHASPPCQRYSQCTPPEHRDKHPDSIAPVRDILKSTGKPYIIENVPGARHELQHPVMLCGTMFGLNIYRHRYFEIWPQLEGLIPPCHHKGKPVLITGTHRRKTGRFEYNVQECRDASGIPWMTRKELDQAIPPAYTEWIGERIQLWEELQPPNGL